MLKNLILFAALILLALPACSAGRTMELTPAVAGYSDTDAERLMIRLESLSTAESSSPFTEDVLEQFGVDIEQLEAVDRWIGDCLDVTAYDLSPSYRLMVDRNACFGLRVWIESKDASG
jgi:hypothetical protein